MVLTDMLDEEGERTAADVGCRYIHHDVTEEGDWADVVTSVVRDHGRIDVLINMPACFSQACCSTRRSSIT